MTQVALPHPDPSIALALKAREEFEHEFLARRPTVEQLIERANQQRTEFMAALVRGFAARLRPSGWFQACASVIPKERT